MKPATPQAAQMIRDARVAGRSVWVWDIQSKAIVGYLLPTGELVRVANAGVLYQRGLNETAAARD
jgi:hypothetical protein